jgi:hypothetical protein
MIGTARDWNYPISTEEGVIAESEFGEALADKSAFGDVADKDSEVASHVVFTRMFEAV